MQEQNPYRKLTLHKSYGTRGASRPAVRWPGSTEENMKTMDVRNWMRKSQDRDQWRVITKEAKVHHGL
jgi:hypothetical protein